MVKDEIINNIDWNHYPNFKRIEFVCHETQECIMHPLFLETLQKIRNIYRKPMIITSGYRSPKHSVEIVKKSPGEHTYGLAADVKVLGVDALELVHIALDEGVNRIGINQTGAYDKRYVHLGIGDRFGLFPQGIWSY